MWTFLAQKNKEFIILLEKRPNKKTINVIATACMSGPSKMSHPDKNEWFLSFLQQSYFIVKLLVFKCLPSVVYFCFWKILRRFYLQQQFFPKNLTFFFPGQEKSCFKLPLTLLPSLNIPHKLLITLSHLKSITMRRRRGGRGKHQYSKSMQHIFTFTPLFLPKYLFPQLMVKSFKGVALNDGRELSMANNEKPWKRADDGWEYGN